MKLVHIAANAPYNDYWGYHENLLPYYHKKLGHDVTLITTNTMHRDGRIVETDCADYMLNDGVRVIRLKPKKYPSRTLTALEARLNVFELLTEIRPDFVFFHGVLSSSLFDVIRYKKKVNEKCTVVCDNHLDYYNGFTVSGIKSRILRAYHRMRIKASEKYVSRYYGVTPWRCRYLTDYFKAPEAKTELLLMGGDDRYIDLKNKDKIRKKIRTELNISDEDFVVISGGKIDKTKNIHLLMKAIAQSGENNIKLIVFGQVLDDVKEEFEELKKNVNIIYIGWIKSEEAYNYFLASDLTVFPGTHSVLWEQACACGIPGMFKEWEGMKHVDAGGSCVFLTQDSADEIKNNILDIYNNKEKYGRMKKAAEENGIKMFSYAEIAKKAIEIGDEA